MVVMWLSGNSNIRFNVAVVDGVDVEVREKKIQAVIITRRCQGDGCSSLNNARPYNRPTMAIVTCLYGGHKRRQKSERGRLVVAILSWQTEIDVFRMEGRAVCPRDNRGFWNAAGF